MLFVDGQKIKVKDFCIRFGIDIEKLQKKASYEIEGRYKKKTAGNRVSIPSGLMFRTKFHAYDKKTGESVEVRYAETASPKTHKTGHVETIYKPRYVGFQSAATASFRKDLDLAVFMFANPANKFSPLRGNGSGKPSYEFVDGQMRAIEKIREMDALAEAMHHAKNVKGHELDIIVKGLKLPVLDPTVEDSVRASLMEFASKNPKGYLEAIAHGLVKAEGRVRYLIEKRVFVLKSQHNSRWWEWGQGEREGERIGNLITNNAQDAVQTLITYINAHFDEYRILIDQLDSKYAAEANALKILAKDKVDAPIEDKKVDSEISRIIENHAELQKFVIAKGYNAAPKGLKDLKEAVRSGNVDDTNVDLYLQQYFNPKD